MSTSLFDAFADDYEASLQQGLSVSGESSDYFAQRRIAWVHQTLSQRSASRLTTDTVLDFGCGTGNAIPWILQILQPTRVLGVDTSEQSIVQARSRFGSSDIQFQNARSFALQATMDLAYCNGVFHHIPPDLRVKAAESIHRSLKPGGWFAFWENNPWNPGTRYVMSKIPFDRDAITLSIPESLRLLKQVGFDVRRVDTCFYFPRALASFRWLESRLSRLPLGAQYLILAQRR